MLCSDAAARRQEGEGSSGYTVILHAEGLRRGVESVLTLRPAQKIALLHESLLLAALSVCVSPS